MKSLSIIGGLLWLSCLLSSPAVGQTISPERLLGRYQQFVWQDQHGLPQNGISAVVQTPDGYLWLATAEGVVRFDGVRFTAFDTSNTSEIKSNNIMSLLVARNGALWIGTHGDGLFRFKDGKFVRITSKNGLYDNLAFQILEDDSGNLWMSGNKGIYRASLQELNDFADGRRAEVNSFAYGTADGMLSRECNGANPAGVKARAKQAKLEADKVEAEAEERIEEAHEAIEEAMAMADAAQDDAKRILAEDKEEEVQKV